MGENITLIQPRHIYAPKEGEGHIYLSAPLGGVYSRLSKVLEGNTIQFIDENLHQINYSDLKGIVGINLVGAPYIPVVLEIIKKISSQCTIILGGQIISSLTEDEFRKIFNPQNNRKIISGNKVKNLENVFELAQKSIPEVEDVNLIKFYEKISDEDMKKYLEREFSLYLSQGCKYKCSFCQAMNRRPEKYRNLDLLKDELLYLSQRAKKLGLNTLNFYLSNLDILQTPDKFENFLDIASSVREETGIVIKFRGLCGLDSFMKVYNENKDILEKAQKAGLTSIGFGVDGSSFKTWKSIGKYQNFSGEQKDEDELSKAENVIRFTSKLGITPEIFMIFGYPGETEEDFERNYNFCKTMMDKYLAIPRPHIAKMIIPGTASWYDEDNQGIVKQFIEDPNLFQALDYTALPSEITHPDEKLRKGARKWYKRICVLSQFSTQYIIPNTPDYIKIVNRLGTTVEKMNEGKFDR